MLLIITRDTPNTTNNLKNLYETLHSRNIPFILATKCDQAIIRRKEILGIIIPGSKTRINPYDNKVDLNTELELFYLFHFPKLPILGICHGCQFLMLYYGGHLIQHDALVTGDKDVKLASSVTCQKGDVRAVFCSSRSDSTTMKLYFNFHDLPVIRRRGGGGGGVSAIKELAWVDLSNIGFGYAKRAACAFEFQLGRVYGCLFHPERHKSSRHFIYRFYDNICCGGDAVGPASS
jgi:GMP synthase-like glutamine amidotransferase